MAELSIATQGALAEAAGVDRDTVGNVLDSKTKPYPGTRAKLARALQWPADWLDYVRRGEDVPPLDRPRVPPADAMMDLAGGRSDDFRSGESLRHEEIRELEFEAAALVAASTSAAGLQLKTATRSDEVGADFAVVRDDRVVGVVEVKTALSGRGVRELTDQLQALRLRTSVTFSDDVAVICLLVGPLASDLAGLAEDEFEKLHDVFGITVAVGDEQLRWALEQVASEASDE